MIWANHCVPEKGIVLYDLNCRVMKSGKHKFDASVWKKDGKFKIYMPARTAGAPFLREYESLEKLNKFLKEAGLETLSPGLC